MNYRRGRHPPRVAAKTNNNSAIIQQRLRHRGNGSNQRIQLEHSAASERHATSQSTSRHAQRQHREIGERKNKQTPKKTKERNNRKRKRERNRGRGQNQTKSKQTAKNKTTKDKEMKSIRDARHWTTMSFWMATGLLDWSIINAGELWN